MFERYTEEARRTLFFARAAVSEHGGHEIGDVHLLLGLAQTSACLATLLGTQAAVQQLAAAVMPRLARSERHPLGTEIPFSDRVARILQNAAQLADARGHRDITPEHLLLALVNEPGEGADSLRQASVVRERVEDCVAEA